MTDSPCEKYFEVAVSAPIDRALTYGAPDRGSYPLVPGMRVLVPLGRRRITGYILEEVDTPPEGQRIRKIQEVLDPEPIFPAAQVGFYRWISAYYHYPIGEVIKTALPAGLTKKSGRRVVLTETGKKHLEQVTEGVIRNKPWFQDLLCKGEISPGLTGRLWQTKERKLFESWEKEGWVAVSSELLGGSVKARTETCCCLVEKPGSNAPLKVSEQKTLTVLEQISVASKRRHVPRREITRVYAGAGRALRSLAEKNIIRFEEQQVYRDPFGESFLAGDIPETLTGEQQKALDAILPAIEKGGYAPFLLHGVTGSGKTEVYLQAAAFTLEQGKSVLVLVPEIALATQLEAHFLARFGSRVALLHSGLSAGERFDQWQRIAAAKADLVIGVRSAVFAPLHDPGLIIVDEEHDSSYKQDDGLRYHARDLAVLRASRSPAAVILGSATPSVTSYYHATQGKYTLLTLAKRIEERPLPTVEVVNMQEVKNVSGKTPVFSPLLLKNLRENLERSEQSLVFLNRRGYANFMICRECGQVIECRHCKVSLTLHRAEQRLVCHYCGFSASSKSLCPNCRSSSLAAVGVGTERLEDELALQLPGARIARLDRDTCRKRNDYVKILRAVHRGDVDILLGTQMITKGHHFPNVTLVGIVLADTGLGLPDFRAGERTFQLISQVTGRAGRGERPGRVVVQTFQPDHYAINLAEKHDYKGMYTREIALRKSLGYPPFSRLVNVRIEALEEAAVQDAAVKLGNLAQRFRKNSEPEILGPVPAPLQRLKDRHRWQLLLKGRRMKPLHGLLHRLEGEMASLTRGGRVRILFDVDPEYMM